MAQSTRKEQKTTEVQSLKDQIVWLPMQMGIVVKGLRSVSSQSYCSW